MTSVNQKVIEILIKARDETAGKFEKAKKNLTAVGNTAKVASNRLKEYDLAARRATAAQDRLNKAMGKSKQQFAGWALSLMFFGMALQRVFNRIWTSATKTFQDVMHSVQGTVTPLDMLNAQFDILRFTVGSALMDALEPLLPRIFEIIDSITTWINENPKLFSSLVAITGVLGTILTIGGMLVLSFNGFVEAIGLIAPALSKLSATTFLTGGIIALLGLAAYEADLGDFKDLVKKTFESIMGKNGILSDIWKNAKDIFKGVWDFIVALLGDDEKELENATHRLAGVLIKAFTNLWAMIIWISENSTKFMIKAMIDVITGNIGKKFNDVMTDLLNPWRVVLRLMAKAGVGWARDIVKEMDKAADESWKSVRELGRKINDEEFLDFSTYQEVKNRPGFASMLEFADEMYQQGVEPKQVIPTVMYDQEGRGTTTMNYYYSVNTDDTEVSLLQNSVQQTSNIRG